MRIFNFLVAVLLTLQINGLRCLELTFGECPLVFLEQCKPKWINFILSMRRGSQTYLYKIDPYNPVFPYDFDHLKPLKIVVHGYGGLKIDSATRNVTAAYQEIGVNVIIVDWASLASVPCYATAYLNTWHVGQCLAVLAVSLMPLGIHPGLVHLVGFSLGAHIVGFAGAHVQRTTGLSFYRITGLDPALPFFATLKNDWKLDKTDAKFVDVIHTSAGFFGKIEPSGDVDFYVNGGVIQPFCNNFNYPPLCSHLLAGLYFAESIRNKTRFLGRECENVLYFPPSICDGNKIVTMGEYVDHGIKGIFYTRTSDKMPFGID